jgi:hypothetical protein
MIVNARIQTRGQILLTRQMKFTIQGATTLGITGAQNERKTTQMTVMISSNTLKWSKDQMKLTFI